MSNRIKLIKPDTDENREKYRRAIKYIHMLGQRKPIQEILKLIDEEKHAVKTITAQECKIILLDLLEKKEEDMEFYQQGYPYNPVHQFQPCIDYIRTHKTSETANIFPGLFDGTGSMIERAVLNNKDFSQAILDKDKVLVYSIESKLAGIYGTRHFIPIHVEFIRFTAQLFCVWSDINKVDVLGISPQEASDYIRAAQQTSTLLEYVLQSYKDIADEKKRILQKEAEATLKRDKDELERKRKEGEDKKQLEEAEAKVRRDQEELEKKNKEAEAKKQRDDAEAERQREEVRRKVEETAEIERKRKAEARRKQEEEETAEEEERIKKLLPPVIIPWKDITKDEAQKYTLEQLKRVSNWNDTIPGTKRAVVMVFAQTAGLTRIARNEKLDKVIIKIVTALKQSGGAKGKEEEDEDEDETNVEIDYGDASIYFDDENQPNEMYHNMTAGHMEAIIATPGSIERIYQSDWQDELPTQALRVFALKHEYAENAMSFGFIPYGELNSAKSTEDRQRQEYLDYLALYFTLNSKLGVGPFAKLPFKTESIEELIDENGTPTKNFRKTLADSVDFRLMLHSRPWSTLILSNKYVIDAIRVDSYNLLILARYLGYEDDPDEDRVLDFILKNVTFKQEKNEAEKKVEEFKRQADLALQQKKPMESFWTQFIKPGTGGVDTAALTKITVDDIENATLESIRTGLPRKILVRLRRDELLALAKKFNDKDVKEDDIVPTMKVKLDKYVEIESALLLQDIQSRLENIERTPQYFVDENVLNIQYISDHLYEPLKEHLSKNLIYELEPVRNHLKLDQPLFTGEHHGMDMTDYKTQIRYLHTLSIVADMLVKGQTADDLIERCYVEWPPKVQAKKGQAYEV